MQRKKDKISLDLDFKTPSPKDAPPVLEYHPLNSKQYLEFLNLSLSMLPDPQAAIEHHKKNKPKVRFNL